MSRSLAARTAARRGQQQLFGRALAQRCDVNSVECAATIDPSHTRSTRTFSTMHAAMTDLPASRFATLAAESTLSTTWRSSASASVNVNPSQSSHLEQSPTDQSSQYYYSTSSFEAALNQVLELERESAGSSSHHQSMENCMKEFFRV